MTWLTDHYEVARVTDQLRHAARHLDALALGLYGEIGGILAECKKGIREADAYPHHRKRLTEELGDALWYLLRIVDVLEYDVALLNPLLQRRTHQGNIIDDAIELGLVGGRLLGATREGGSACRDAIGGLADALANLAASAKVEWHKVVCVNRGKILGRWPEHKEDRRVAERTKQEEERFPTSLCVEFREIERGTKKVVILRCRGLNFGDRLTDNMKEPDYYRFHDVFHFSYAVLLGWSPVLRDLLKCKRKSLPCIDENQDGARAQIVEEAVSAYIFAHAKQMKYFDGITQLDYDLLKAVEDLVAGYEVDTVPLYHWEEAILEGYRVFRKLTCNRGGVVELDFDQRRLTYIAVSRRDEAAPV